MLRSFVIKTHFLSGDDEQYFIDPLSTESSDQSLLIRYRDKDHTYMLYI